jgi:cyclophilin family peptidyl-prolyl cis-trans isomerase
MVSTGLLYSFASSLTHSLPHSLTPSLNQGIDTNGSQFYISLNKNDQMNGRCVVFGRLIDGEETLKAIETVFTFKGAPARDVIVHSVGALEK